MADSKENYTLRCYNLDTPVAAHYREMREKQTVDYVLRMREKWLKFDRGKFTVWQVINWISDFVDSSDPDLNLPNIIHFIQTAERAKADGRPRWYQLICFLHDIGKAMVLWGDEEDGQSREKQWGLVGDTFVVGARLPEDLVYPEFNQYNRDVGKEFYMSDLGVYEANCGIDNVLLSFGHDDYLYYFLRYNGVDLPEDAFTIARYHSFYPWHTNGAYRQFMSEGDWEKLEVVREFNQYDLYTKTNEGDWWNLLGYYRELVEEFMPGEYAW